jgi:hypothetical protein
MPVEEPTVAVAVGLALQVPPVAASARFVVKPEHTLRLPLIAPGAELTVTTVVAVQPDPKV